jgi:hypothetical protein
MIAEWCEILTSVLDRRSRKYFFTIILGMLLGCGCRPPQQKKKKIVLEFSQSQSLPTRSLMLDGHDSAVQSSGASVFDPMSRGLQTLPSMPPISAIGRPLTVDGQVALPEIS